MRTLRTVLVACGISAVIVGGSVGAFCWATYESPPAIVSVESSTTSTPRVWADSQSEEIARLFTKDRVWVYRWENGLADASAKFEGMAEQAETPLDGQKSFVKGLRESVGRSISASELSGEVVIVISELPEATADDPDHCTSAMRIVFKLTWKSPSGDRSQACTWERNGRVKSRRGLTESKSIEPRSNSLVPDSGIPAIQFMSTSGGPEAHLAVSGEGKEPWLTLKVVDPSHLGP